MTGQKRKVRVFDVYLDGCGQFHWTVYSSSPRMLDRLEILALCGVLFKAIEALKKEVEGEAKP